MLLFNLEMGERLSSQPRIEPLRALLVPSLGGLLLGVAFLLLLLRWRPAREIDPIEANALHGGRCRFAAVSSLRCRRSGPAASAFRSGLKLDIPSLPAASAPHWAAHLRRADQRIMVGCGAAAAIAGAFGAPLAGVFLSTGRRFCLSSIKTMVGVHPDVMARFDNGESADRTAPVAAAVWAFQKNKWGGGAMRFNGRAWERFGELQTGN
jgi:hypothetical protein